MGRVTRNHVTCTRDCRSVTRDYVAYRDASRMQKAEAYEEATTGKGRLLIQPNYEVML